MNGNKINFKLYYNFYLQPEVKSLLITKIFDKIQKI
jgi:hypothetical protein